MLFKKKTWKIGLVIIFSCSILLTTGLTIYFFGLKTFQQNSVQSLTQPVFQQTEINWITQEKSFIFSRFKTLLENKTKAINFQYFVDDYYYPTVIKVKNQTVEWIYQLRY